MDYFDWRPSESAPSAYPMHIIKAYFTDARNQAVRIPDNRTVNNGWGAIGSTHIVGEDIKPLPIRLNTTWFSFTENQFYTGSFDLPYDAILALFRSGFTNPANGQHLTYDRIIVGFGLEGIVTVWLEGNGVEVEAATFHATATELDWSLVLDNDSMTRDAYIQAVLADTLSPSQRESLSRQGIPRGLYSLYRTRYLWRPETPGPVQPALVWIAYLNGEKERVIASPEQPSATHRAVPQRLDMEWTHDGQVYFARILLDEREMMTAFSHMTEGNLDRPLRFLIEISDIPGNIDLFIRAENLILKLEHAQKSVFRK